MDIIRSFEHAIGKYVVVCIGEESGNSLMPVPVRVATIQGDDYTELMSSGPTWAPNKPADTFRTEDLWAFLNRPLQ